MEEHVRCQIRLETAAEANDFVNIINQSDSKYRYIVENFSGTERVSARSLLGVIYATADFNSEMFLVNDTENGFFPASIDKYRV